MHHALLVFLGGGLGSLSRYLVSVGVMRLGTAANRPTSNDAGAHAGAPMWAGMAGTLLVNVVGCLLIGLVWGRWGPEMREESRLLLVVGFLGGFTTFSAIGWEGFTLLIQGRPVLAGLSILLTVALGLIAVWLGHTLGRGGLPVLHAG